MHTASALLRSDMAEGAEGAQKCLRGAMGQPPLCGGVPGGLCLSPPAAPPPPGPVCPAWASLQQSSWHALASSRKPAEPKHNSNCFFWGKQGILSTNSVSPQRSEGPQERQVRGPERFCHRGPCLGWDLSAAGGARSRAEPGAAPPQPLPSPCTLPSPPMNVALPVSCKGNAGFRAQNVRRVYRVKMNLGEMYLTKFIFDVERQCFVVSGDLCLL